MAQTFQGLLISKGATIDYTPTADTAAGQVVVVGSLVGVATTAISANVLGALHVEGVFDVVKANGAISAGAIVYWDADGNPQGGTAGTGCATTTSGGNSRFGVTLEAAAETAETCRVLWVVPVAVTQVVTSAGAGTTEITDPGNAGAIPVVTSGTVMLVSTEAGGETRTLADPAFVGQEITLTMLTDGGDIEITAASPINQTGNTVMTFAAVRDTIKLVGIEAAASNEWQVAFNDGVALS